MKKINIFIIIIVGIMITFGCSEIDNYKVPDSGIYGVVTDNITGEPIQTEQPNGFRIKMLEKDYENPIPIFFWGKEDGSFRNTKVFSGQYEIVPIEGAFFEPGSQTIDVNGITEVNFTVTPFLGVSASVRTEGNDIITNYTINRTQAGDKIITRMTIISENPRLNKNVFDEKVASSLSEISDETILATQFSDTIKGVDLNKTTYVRVGACTSLGRYNYSEVFELE
jgi:hypothetical protein